MYSVQLNLKLAHKGLILVGTILVLELSFIGVLTVLLSQAEQAAEKEAHAKDIVGTTNHIFQLLYDAGTAAADFQMRHGGERSKTIFHEAAGKLYPEFDRLKELVKDNPSYRGPVEVIYKKGTKGLRILEVALGMAEQGNTIGAGYVMERVDLQALKTEVLNGLRELMSEQEAILRDSPEAKRQSRDQVVHGLIVLVLCNILVAVSMGVLFVRGITGRLAVLVDNTKRLAAGTALRDKLEGVDEIAHLDNVFHEMAAKLAEAQRKERALIENARDVICSIDERFTFAKVSAASMQVWGYQPDELIGQDFSLIVLPEDRVIAQKCSLEIKEGSRLESFESRVRKKDGAVVHILWSAHWSKVERSLYCVAHDITDRKLAEELLRASEKRIRSIVDSMLVGLMVVREDAFIESINPRISQMTGYTAEELEGSCLLRLFAESRIPDGRALMNNLLSKATGHTAEFRAVRKGGAELPIEVSVTEIQSVEGNRFLLNVMDITERYEIERMKQEFVAMISHDLRTPLNSVQGFLEMLTEGIYGPLTEQGEHRAGMAERNVSRLLRLINDLLDVTKLEAGKLELHLEETQLEDVLNRSIEAVRVFAEKHFVQVELSQVHVSVLADGDRLERVLVNLLSNAVKFSPSNSIVSLKVEETDQWVEVKVQDRGRGIPASHIDSVFERFKQVQVSDAKTKGGTGLGLAICKAIIEQHGGNIGVESEEGKGSTFWFKIPQMRNNLNSADALLINRV